MPARTLPDTDHDPDLHGHLGLLIYFQLRALNETRRATWHAPPPAHEMRFEIFPPLDANERDAVAADRATPDVAAAVTTTTGRRRHAAGGCCCCTSPWVPREAHDERRRTE